MGDEREECQGCHSGVMLRDDTGLDNCMNDDVTETQGKMGTVFWEKKNTEFKFFTF